MLTNRLAYLAVTALAFTLFAAPKLPAQTPAAAAPVIQQDRRLPEIPLHDPWILADAGTKTYYLYTSNNARATGINRPGTIAYRSKDLSHWEGPIVVFTLPEDTWASAKIGAWAPEVHQYKGKYYLCTTLHNPDKVIAHPPDTWHITHMRGTTIAVSNSPEGPFTLVKTDGPIPPADFMTLDGTLYTDRSGKPWMVYAHEWIQKIDGTMEAVPLADDLTHSSGDPIYLFKASDAPWLDEHGTASNHENTYVTDGPELFRSKDGHLLMLWSSYDRGSYIETITRSKSGELQGPWEQLPPLIGADSGHGMLFHTFDGQLMLILHRPFKNARGKLYELTDEGDHLKVVRERTDLDGDISGNSGILSPPPR